MTRLKAASIHFLLSLTVFTVIVLMLLYFWYPGPHFSAAGGWQGLRIVAGVDLVLGPLLTLIVFNLTKPRKELKLDLLFIMLIQLSALIYGVNVLYQQRPIVVVFYENRFYSVSASIIADQEFKATDIIDSDKKGPFLAYIKPIKMFDKQKEILEKIASDKLDIYQQADLYQPFKQYFSDIKKYKLTVDELSENADVKAQFLSILDKTGKQYDDFEFYPLLSDYKRLILVFNHEGDVVDYLVVSDI